MPDSPNFDLQAAHKFFSANCFNQAWDLIDKPERTLDEDEQMIRLGLASLYHWTQRPDCTAKNLSIGYWQISRIYSLATRLQDAILYGKLCLKVSQEADLPPFYLGYAYEALARAEAKGGNKARMNDYLAQANRFAQQVSDLESKEALLNDLDTIR
jgi:hypothetical protein